jgi:hypothetical protein
VLQVTGPEPIVGWKRSSARGSSALGTNVKPMDLILVKIFATAGKAGEILASGLERTTSATSQLSSQLYDGRISWGEYNKGRIDIMRRTEAEAKDLIHN